MSSEQQPRSPWSHLLSSDHPTLSPPVVRGTQVTTLYDALTPLECRALIDTAERSGFQTEDRPLDPLHRQPGPSTRVADRVDITDPVLLQRLMDRLRPWLPPSLNGEDQLDEVQIGRIQRFVAPHRLKVKDDLLPAGMPGTRLVLLIHLNHNVSGGNLLFPNGVAVGPREGTVVWSTARAQGEPVFGGTHYLMRLDLRYREAEAIAA